MAGSHNGGPACPGQKAHALFSALIQAIGLLQKPFDHAGQRRGKARRSQPGLRIYALFTHPLTRKVEPSHAGVFTNIACNVGELHGHTQLAGSGHWARLTHAHHKGHHGAHRACHPRAVIKDILKGLVDAALGVPFKALKQRQRNSLGNFVATHHTPERLVHHRQVFWGLGCVNGV